MEPKQATFGEKPHQNNRDGHVAVPDEDLLGLLEVGDPAVRDEQDDGVVVLGLLRADVRHHVVEYVAVSRRLR